VFSRQGTAGNLQLHIALCHQMALVQVSGLMICTDVQDQVIPSTRAVPRAIFCVFITMVLMVLAMAMVWGR